MHSEGRSFVVIESAVALTRFSTQSFDIYESELGFSADREVIVKWPKQASSPWGPD
jgi:hypothetical protein